MARIAWKKEEKELLIKTNKYIRSGEMSLDDLQKILCARTKASIRCMLQDMGLTTVPESKINMDYIKDLSKRGIKI